VFSQPVTFTAAVAASGGGVPTGTVTFKDGVTVLGTGTLDANGRATLAVSTAAVGSHAITAVYGGGAGFGGSTSPSLTQVVSTDGTTVTLTSSLNPSVHNQSVTFTAKAVAKAPGTAIPTGTVTFKDGNRTLGTANLNSGSATLAISNLSKGAHSITAVYGGSASFGTSTSAVLNETVN
jgi:hypothetical protein